MGAGDDLDHFLQDTAETYWTYIVQKKLEEKGLNISSVEERETIFNEYCIIHSHSLNIIDGKEKFCESPYKKNMDLVVNEWVDKLISIYPDKKMDITYVAQEFRNLSMKGDFKITIEGIPEPISFSLKNYKSGDISRIQLCSGTWHSLINGYALNEGEGPGMFIDVNTGGRFRAQKSDLTQRDNNYRQLGLENIIENINEIDQILNEIKQKYIESNETKNFNDISKQWKTDCETYGIRGIDITIKALDKIPPEIIKRKFLEKSGLCYKEELLIIGNNGNMICTLMNDKYKSLMERVNKESCNISYIKHGKSIRFSVLDEGGEIIKIDIPFTLQKNGAWYLPKEKYEGSIYHKKEGVNLVYGERRPKKCKEINTSTNMWINIASYIY